MIRIKKFNEFINENYSDNELSVGDIFTESDIYPYVQNIHKNEDDFYDGDIGERIERFKKYEVALIDVDKINMDEYYLDDDIVNKYINIYKENKTYPPIVLGYYDSNWGYDIIDGNHRANALKEFGLKQILCFVGLNSYQEEVK